MPTNRNGENIFSSQMEFHFRGDSDKDRGDVPVMTFHSFPCHHKVIHLATEYQKIKSMARPCPALG